jgi:hypothetical protein
LEAAMKWNNHNLVNVATEANKIAQTLRAEINP